MITKVLSSGWLVIRTSKLLTALEARTDFLPRVLFLVRLLQSLIDGLSLWASVVCAGREAFGLVSVDVEDKVGLHGRESLHELLERDLSVSIKVKPAHNSNELLLDWLVTNSFQVPAEGGFVNEPIIQRVNGLKGSPDVKVLESLHI